MSQKEHSGSSSASRRRFLEASGAALFTGLVGTKAAGLAQTAADDVGQPTAGTGPVLGPVFSSGRDDGRFPTSTAFMHAYMKNLRPKLAFDPTMKPEDFPAWREAVRAKLQELMGFPEGFEPQPEPQRIWSKQRDGYRLEEWEAYPEPYCFVRYLMLIPDGISAHSPGPAVMCFPGTSASKESLAGELELDGKPSTHRWAARNQMALEYARGGMVAVALTNPPRNDEFIWNSLWMGRPYEGISVFHRLCILEWLKRQPYVDSDRIATSGHSLGAKPALILGVLDPTVKAVVWNCGITSWRKRAVGDNLATVGMGTFQYVPGLLAWLDYHPDMEAALAPRAFLGTEGGRGPILDRIRDAYRLAGAPDQVKIVHFPEFATPDKRPFDGEDYPTGGLRGYDRMLYSNMNPDQHYFKATVAVPWLSKILQA